MPKPFRPLATLVFAIAAAAGSHCAWSAPATSTCLLLPSMEVNVGTPTDGTLEVVNADRGDVVQKGQLLARLNIDVETASAAHAAAKAEFGKRKFQRNEELFSKKLISSQELDEIQTEKELSRLEHEERKEHLRLRSVFSPIRGVVVDRFHNPGDLVKQEKLFRLAQLDPLYVEMVVPAELFGRVAVGQSRPVDLPMLAQRPTAKVVAVDRVIDPASGTFRVRMSLPNPKFAIPSGVRCNVDF